LIERPMAYAAFLGEQWFDVALIVNTIGRNNRPCKTDDQTKQQPTPHTCLRKKNCCQVTGNRTYSRMS
jgi:hypothetical protein